VRYLVLSDIHSNIDALDAVLEDAGRTPVDAALVLGDLVGYGGAPEQVVGRIRALTPLAIVRGNHDKVVAGLDSDEGFNPAARASARLTRPMLSADALAYLAALPKGPVKVDPVVEICHGAPDDEDAYLFGSADFARALDAAERPVCLFGHTHLPRAAERAAGRAPRELVPGGDDEVELRMKAGRRYIANPGSVGQPRDGNPHAAYAVVDTEQMVIAFRRVPYPVSRARERVAAAGFPAWLGDRLLAGR
jgi:predicted phosphodiesterase